MTLIIQNSQAKSNGNTLVNFRVLSDDRPISDFVTIEQGEEQYEITDSKKLLRIIGDNVRVFSSVNNPEEDAYNKVVNTILSNTTLDADLICSLAPNTGVAAIARQIILVPASENIKIEFDPEYLAVQNTAVGSITDLTEGNLNSEGE